MFKQRLVGFIVLGALAIIFWPIVFVSPEPDQELMLPVFEMPERPDVVMSERREPILERVDRNRLPVIERAEISEETTLDVIATDPQADLIAADNEPNTRRRPTPFKWSSAQLRLSSNDSNTRLLSPK